MVRRLVNRAWILAFADAHFTHESFLQLSDFGPSRPSSQYTPRGVYDHTLARDNFQPKLMPSLQGRDAFDAEYFSTMAQCRFCLCPAGDLPFSMRFYEALMADCLPVVSRPKETFRSFAESRLPYRFLLASAPVFEYRQDWVRDNRALFKRYHTLSAAAAASSK